MCISYTVTGMKVSLTVMIFELFPVNTVCAFGDLWPRIIFLPRKLALN